MLPLVFAIVVAWQLTRILPTPGTWPGVVFWWLLVMASSTMALRFADRFAKRLMPLAVLMKLSLVFPDKAPSRFGVSLKSGNAHTLEDLLERAERAGKQNDLTEAAETILALAAALNAHDPRTRGHGDRVRAYADMLGEEMGYTDEERNKLKWAAMLHDIGKLRVPSEVINSPGKLTDEEWQIMRNHPDWGMELAAPLLPWLGEFAAAIGQHHERFDGKGYPNGLAGEEIGLAARVTSVADTYDVMTSVRSYKDARPASEAREELARCAGGQFDPVVVRAFLNISLGRQRWVAGPLSWLAQVPFFQGALQGATTLAQNAAVAAQTGLAATAIGATAMVAPAIIASPDITPAALPSIEVVANDDVLTLAEDGSDAVVLIANDGDVDASSITILSGPSHGTVTVTDDGTLIYTPDPEFSGTDTVTYEACGPDGTCDTAVLSINVTEVNDPPGLAPVPASLDEDTSTVIDVLAAVWDIDGDAAAAEVTLVGIADEGLVIANGDGTFTYTPPPDFNGTDAFTVQICDEGGACALRTLSVTVGPVNDAPEVDVVIPVISEDSSASIFVDASDADGDVLTTTIVSGPSGGSAVVDLDGSVFYTPDADFSGPESLTIEVCDATTCTSEVISFTVVDVNDPPVVPGPGPLVTTEETMISFDPLAGASDPEGGALVLDSYDAVSANGGSIVAGSLEYTPAADFVGVDSFSYAVADSGGATTSVLVIVTVTGVNDSPVAADDAYAVAEDGVLAVSPTGLLANDSDVDGDSLAAALEAPPANGAAVVNADGSFTYTPAADFVGSDSFTYRIDDGAGGSDIGAVTVTVTPVNDPPTAVDDGASTAGPGAVNVDVLSNDVDVEGDFDPSSVAVVGAATKGTTVVKPDGTIDYTPNFGETGSDAFVYEICDLSALCDTATVTIGINGPNAVDDADSMAEDAAPITINAVANDTDPNLDLDPTTAVVQSPASNGVATANGDGTFDYDSAPDFVGVDAFDYKVCDLTAACNIATVTITVTPVNDDPVAVDDGATIPEDSVLGVTFNVLTNDTDVDLDSLSLDSYDGSSIVNGVLTDDGGGTFTYVPAPNFFGIESFMYDVTDGLATDTGTVTITVTNVPDAPATQDDAYSTDRDVPIVETLPGLLTNDTDYDGDPLVALLASPPANGGVVLNPDGSFTYTPNPGYTGPDSFTYTADDGLHPPVPGTVDIVVDDGIVATGWFLGESGSSPDTWAFVSSPPPLGNPDPDGDGNPGLTIGSSGGNESESDPLKFQNWLLTPSTAPVELNGPVTLKLWSTVALFELGKDIDVTVWVHDCDISGTVCGPSLVHYDVHQDDWNGGVADFVYHELTLGALDHTVAVGRSLRVRLMFDHEDVWVGVNADHPSEVVLTEANRPPATGPDSGSLLEDAGPINIDVLANDVDPNLDPLSLSVFTPPTNGSALVVAGPTIDYDPNPDFFGADSFTYEICDTTSACSTQAVTILVTSVNDVPSFTVGADQLILEDAGGQTVDPHPTGLTPGPANESGQSLSFNVSNDNPPLFKNQPTIDNGGKLQYEAWGDVSGVATVTVNIEDDGGIANGGVDTSANQTFTITVTGVNDEPGFNDGPDVTVNEDTGPHTLPGWATAITAGAPEEEPPTQVLTFEIMSNDNVPLFTAGPTVDSASGDLTFTLAADQNGTANIQLRIGDDGGTANGGIDVSPVQPFKITVDPVNDAPDAVDDPTIIPDPAFTTIQDETTPLVIPAAQITGNDSDVEGDPISIVAAGPAASANGGTYNCSAAGCDYVPPTGFTGDDTFTYTITDGSLPSLPATITIRVESRSADLSVVATSAAPDPVTVGNPVKFTYDIDNAGPDATGGVNVWSDLPATAIFSAATSTKGSCSYDGIAHRVTCAIGNMTVPQPETVEIDVIPSVAGTLTLNATAGTLNSGDPAPGNNSDGLTVTVDPAEVLISEFRPAGPLGPDDEFVEIFNAGSTAVNLTGWNLHVTSGVDVDFYTFPSVTLNPGQHYLVANASVAGPLSADGIISGVLFGPAWGDVQILTPVGFQVDAFHYGTGPTIGEGTPLPTWVTTGIEGSFERRDGLTYGNCVDTGDNLADFVRNHGKSTPQSSSAPATPCSTPPTADSLIISEFRTAGPAGFEDEFIEIFNPTAAPVDISFWQLELPGSGTLHTYQSGTTVPAGGRYVVAPGSGYPGFKDDTYNGVIGFPYLSFVGGHIELRTDTAAVVDAVAWGGFVAEGTQLPDYTAFSTFDRSYDRGFTGCVDLDANLADFIVSWQATPGLGICP